jgi:predicted ATP-dependent protease
MHGDYIEEVMRTTIEIADEHRVRLVELAARRKEKGFSRIVSEAIEQYFEALDRAEADRRKALKLRGSLSPEQAERLEPETTRIRSSWR